MIFYSNALVCFLAGHLKRLLRRLSGSFRLGGTNLPCLSTRYRAADSLNKGKAAGEAARLKPCLLESRSRTYIKYRSFGEMFQALFWAKESIADLKLFPTRCQSPRRAWASRLNPVSKSGRSSRVWPVMSKAEAKPFRKVGNLKLWTRFTFFILQIYQIRRVLQARLRRYFFAFFTGFER